MREKFNNRLNFFCIKIEHHNIHSGRQTQNLKVLTICNHNRKTSWRDRWHHTKPQSTLSNSTHSSFMPLKIRQRTAWLDVSVLHVSLSLQMLFHVWKSVTKKPAIYFGWRNDLFFINILSVIYIVNVFKCVGETLHKWNQLEKSYPNYRPQDLHLSLYLHCVKHSIRVTNAVSKTVTHVNLVHLE